MKIKKTVTDAVVEANRVRAKSSTGPKTSKGKSASSRNSQRRGLLAKAVFFETDEQRAAYGAMWKSWSSHFTPENPLELFLVEEIINCSWKLAIAESLETKELARRHQTPEGVMGIFENKLNLPIDAGDLPLDHGWDCAKLAVRAVARDDHSSVSGTRKPLIVENQWVDRVKELSGSQSRHGGNLEIEAVLSDSLENLSRYGRTLRNNLYRAVKQLRILQGEEEEKV